MSRLIALVMVVAVLGSLARAIRGDGARLGALALCVAPTLLAGARVVPNAVRLGQRRDEVSKQSALAHAICRDHLLCLALIGAFTILEICAPS